MSMGRSMAAQHEALRPLQGQAHPYHAPDPPPHLNPSLTHAQLPSLNQTPTPHQWFDVYPQKFSGISLQHRAQTSWPRGKRKLPINGTTKLPVRGLSTSLGQGLGWLASDQERVDWRTCSDETKKSPGFKDPCRWEARHQCWDPRSLGPPLLLRSHLRGRHRRLWTSGSRTYGTWDREGATRRARPLVAPHQRLSRHKNLRQKAFARSDSWTKAYRSGQIVKRIPLPPHRPTLAVQAIKGGMTSRPSKPMRRAGWQRRMAQHLPARERRREEEPLELTIASLTTWRQACRRIPARQVSGRDQLVTACPLLRRPLLVRLHPNSVRVKEERPVCSMAQV